MIPRAVRRPFADSFWEYGIWLIALFNKVCENIFPPYHSPNTSWVLGAGLLRRFAVDGYESTSSNIERALESIDGVSLYLPEKPPPEESW